MSECNGALSVLSYSWLSLSRMHQPTYNTGLCTQHYHYMYVQVHYTTSRIPLVAAMAVLDETAPPLSLVFFRYIWTISSTCLLSRTFLPCFFIGRYVMYSPSSVLIRFFLWAKALLVFPASLSNTSYCSGTVLVSVLSRFMVNSRTLLRVRTSSLNSHASSCLLHFFVRSAITWAGTEEDNAPLESGRPSTGFIKCSKAILLTSWLSHGPPTCGGVIKTSSP